VVLIATFHGFIAPGEAVNFGVFDPAIKYHFEVFNNHVNEANPPAITALPSQKAAYLKKVTVNRQIDVTFSPRTAGNDDTGTPDNSALPEAVRRPSPQTATVTLKGFGPKTLTFPGLKTTAPSLAVGDANAPAQELNDLTVGENNVKFFAGIVDDPFFFDIPAFSALIESVRQNNVNLATLDRGRDTFAGYNCLAIALKFPKSMLLGTTGTKIGADFMTLRGVTQQNSSLGAKNKPGAVTAIDRMGNPGINVAFVPFNLKNAYNGGNAAKDIQLKYAGALPTVTGIVDVLAALGISSDAPTQVAKDQFALLSKIAIQYGDILILDTAVANTGTNGGTNTGTGFGTAGGGRRLNDDVIDVVLSVVARALTGNASATLGDNVGPGQDGFLPQDTFPFLHKPHQPQPRSGAANVPDVNVDDGTRN
jgi:hypothetical protein